MSATVQATRSVVGDQSHVTPLLSELNLAEGYSTGRNDLVREFYLPCLAAADAYDRAVGYFRSSLYILVGVAYSDFALRGGTTRIVCSPNLSAVDIDALTHGYEARDVVGDAISEEVTSILLNPDSRPVAEFLGALIAAGALDMKLAFRPSEAGIFHDKVGIFRDSAQNCVTFVGSANETYSAWDLSANHEGFEVFCSWRGEREAERIVRHLADFNELWQNRANGVVVRDFPDAARNRLLEASNNLGIDEASTRVRQLVEARARVRSSTSTPAGAVRELPRRHLQPHQNAVIENWVLNGHRGIIDHVTGAGKTVTALSAIRRWVTDGRPALILVPTELLAKQWQKEISRDLADIPVNVMMAGAGHGRRTWIDDLPDFTRNMPDLGPRIVIATMATASSPQFLQKMISGEHLLMVADEVHRMGSPGHRAILEIAAGGRLGLSATPRRFGDVDGSAAVLDYFGPVLAPGFSIGDAIRAGRLVPYDYFVHNVALTSEEQQRWDALTTRIKRAYAILQGRLDEGAEYEQFKRLLFQRASILKQAEGKVPLARAVLAASYKDGDRWLVYCDSQPQLRQVLAAFTEDRLPAYEYHSAMIGERAATLDYFTTRGGILVAIRCLDEGVDIPSVNRALILASSTNAREFIQRRGRVLRAAPDKYSAQIHDVLVVPAQHTTSDAENDTIVRGELHRAAEFASYARNTSVRVELDRLAHAYGLDDLDRLSAEIEDE